MSQGTPINRLGQDPMNQDDSRLVDSILNDLNTTDGQQQQQQHQPQQQQQQQQQQHQQQGQQAQQISPEEHRDMLDHRQQQMMEQQMMQQQMMMQQQRDTDNESMSILDKVQLEWKSILIIIVLSVVVNTDMVNGLFKMNDMKYFIQEDGALNIQAVIIKAILVGGLFFALRTALDQ